MDPVVPKDILLAELFDALPESVILFRPVRNGNNEISDFEIGYCNNTACVIVGASKEAFCSETLRTSSYINEPYKISVFKQLLQVWETGKPYEDVFYDEVAGIHFSSLKRKIKEGVISISRDRTEYLDAEKLWREHLFRFTRILEASADGVMILEAMRDEEGEVTDFRLIHCNKAGFKLGKITPSSIGKTLLEILPHLTGSEQFRLHKKVIDTGLPERIETTFRNEEGHEYGWFIVSLMKMEDCVVSRFIDLSEKKENSEKIAEQADLLKSIFEASINGIFACEAIRNSGGEIVDLKLIKINEAFTRMLNISAREAEGATYHSIFPMGKKIGFFNLYCQVIQTGMNLRKEIFYDDERIRGWYDVSAVKNGNNGIVVTFTDITESKLNKQAVEDGAKYLQDVIDSSQTGIFLLSPVTDTDGRITDFIIKIANQTLAEITHRFPSNLVGNKYLDIFAGNGMNELFGTFQEIGEGNELEKRFEYHLELGGIKTWMDVRVKKLNDDLLITFLDITPIRKLQEEIVAAAKKLTTVLHNAAAGMFTLFPVYNDDGEIEDFRFGIVNQAVATYIGEKAENLKGALGSTYFPAYKTNGLLDIYKDTYLSHREHQFDFHYEDGYDVYFNIHTVRAGDEVLVTFTDQSTFKKLQAQLEASIVELKKLNSGLEEFAYAASHDLQEPLRKINYFSERLRKGVGERLSQDETKMFERMENAAARMTQLINDLLTYSRISRNNRGFHPTNLMQIVQRVLNDLETRISEKKAIISIGELPIINGDPVQLSQLFQNLLSNSLKYSHEDTAPVISIACEEVLKLINGVTRKFYEIQVADNGIGFEQEHAERIFKVFHRLHGQSEFPGTGIGLAIVQKVVENHSGVITAEGTPGQGSKFTILFPEG
jgi:signal transduction histidine kinase